MKEVTCYTAFDGTIFTSSEECKVYENTRLLASTEHIIFYADNGKRIAEPTEQVLIDSNSFKVFNEDALTSYHNYCKHLGIDAPSVKKAYVYPCHFKYLYGGWICLEECIEKYKKMLKDSFKEEFLNEEEKSHDLV